MSTATQLHCYFYHVHKDVLDKFNVSDLMNEFIMSFESHAAVIGGSFGLNYELRAFCI